MHASEVTLRDLSLILEVADRRSFTDAADAIHMSQSALSRAVNEAERRLGARLFDRTTRSVEPTAVGLELIRIARSVLARYEQGLREFALYRDGLGGVVQVATLPSVAATVLPPLVAALGRDAPDIVVNIDDTLAHLAIERLIAGHVDLAITVDDGLPEEVDFTPLSSDRFRVFYRRDHTFHGREFVTWRELSEQSLVTFGKASSIRTLTDTTFESIGVEPGPATEAQNIAVIAGLVASGLGVAAAPVLVGPLMQFADLESSWLVEPTVDRLLGMAKVRGRPLSPAAQHFADKVQASENR